MDINSVAGDIKNEEILGALAEISEKLNKEAVQTSDLESLGIKEPVNPTDPKVVFDPSYGFSAVVTPYFAEDDNPDTKTFEREKLSQNVLKVDAIRVPLIKLNNKVIQVQHILDFRLSFKEFLPKLYLVIEDLNGTIQSSDVPGMNNIITVILTAPVEGANKKISLDFYITSCVFNSDTRIIYEGEFRLIGLKQIKTKQLGKSELNTYDCLQEIAKDLKLGFAATDKCKDIEDKKWRQIYGETYIDYIKQEIDYGGVDEDSIFDTWIDPFGYLVLVNIPFIMNEEIDYKQLTTTVVKGITNTESNDILPEQKVDNIVRVITNAKGLQFPNNLSVSLYNSIVNTEDIIEDGTFNGYYYLSSPGDQNLIQFKQIQVVEESIDGTKGAEEYKYEKTQFIGVEQQENIPKLIQKRIRKNYLNKIYTKQLEVYLDTPNYKLERGTLVQTVLFEYDKANKRNIMNNYKNSFETEIKVEQVPNTSKEDIDILMDDRYGLPNTSLSGLYYIKEVEFIYHEGYENIQQRLVLVKKGIQNNLVNKYAPSKYYPRYS